MQKKITTLDNIKQILLKHLRNELNAAEQTALQTWLAENNSNKTLLAQLENEKEVTELLAKFEKINEEKAWETVKRKSIKILPVVQNLPTVPSIKKQPKIGYKWWAAAAVFVGIIGLATYIFVQSYNKKENGIAKINNYKNQPDILPGGDKAVLTLADGTRITLDSAADGNLTKQGGMKVIKLTSGQLEYKGNTENGMGEMLYNTISTPKGGQYELVLADGTKVWLNAASTFRFPVAFMGNSRKVTLVGEGYFEVAKNAASPFIVDVQGTEVTVLGTHFNIMAYANEPAQEVTLLEGSVRVSKGINSVLIKPGQQASIQNGIKILDVETEESVAWKNGEFIFTNTNIKDIMRQLERWYDVDIDVADSLKDRQFYGVVSRTATLSKVLNMLEVTGQLHFEMNGKKVLVK